MPNKGKKKAQKWVPLEIEIEKKPESRMATSTEPSHSVSVTFPERGLLQPGEKLMTWMPINESKRYEPFPLVPDTRVEANFPGFNSANNHFMTLYRAEAVHDVHFAANGDLASDMAKCVACAGFTDLRVVSFVREGDPSPSDVHNFRVRVERTSHFYRPGAGLVTTEPKTYESNTNDWKFNDLNEPDPEPWQEDITDLLIQRGDRAARHFKDWLAVRGQTYTDYYNREIFKAPRQKTIPDALQKMITVIDKPTLDAYNATLPTDERVVRCNMCFLPYDDMDSPKIARLPCSDKHCFCFECLSEWAKFKGLDDFRCVFCARKLAGPEINAQLAPNGFDINEEFARDHLYTDYENFERCCADLDIVHAKNNTAPLIIVDSALADTWCYLVQDAPESGDEPRHEPRNLPDFARFESVFYATVAEHAGRVGTVQEFYNSFTATINKYFQRDLLNGGFPRFMNAEQISDFKKDDGTVPVRPDFKTFMERTLSRVLQFQVVRACEEEHEDCTVDQYGFHLHGDRPFFFKSAALQKLEIEVEEEKQRKAAEAEEKLAETEKKLAGMGGLFDWA